MPHIESFIIPTIKKEFNHQLNRDIYYIDGIPTIINSIKGNCAIGYIVIIQDLSLRPCFIMKKEDVYAHADTLHEAHKILHDKFEKIHNIQERITKFKTTFPDYNQKVPAEELFEWHYYLTGSCKLGKLAVIKDKNIDVAHDLISVNEFIELSKGKFGYEIIEQLV